MIRLFQGFCVIFALLVLATPLTAETYGEGVTLQEATPIADLMADPASFKGKTVRVEGKVNAVCENMGCWMLLKADGGEVRIKVDDGVIVFPLEAVGKQAVAQGEVNVKSMPREAWISWQKHLAEEIGETFDDSKVGDGPFLRVQIAGTGAEIPAG